MIYDPGAQHRNKTHCPNGHAYDEANTRFRANGWRICRACDKARQRAAWRKKYGTYTRTQNHADNISAALRQEDATYLAAHKRMYRDLGPARLHVCACGAPAQEWAYSHCDPDEQFNERGQPYSLSAANYWPMCISCHRQFDKRTKREKETCQL